MGAAIVGMHYTGMAAAHFAPTRVHLQWPAPGCDLARPHYLDVHVSDPRLDPPALRHRCAITIDDRAFRRGAPHRQTRSWSSAYSTGRQLQSANQTLQAEMEARRESQQLLQAIIDNSQAVVYVKDWTPLSPRESPLRRDLPPRARHDSGSNRPRQLCKGDCGCFPRSGCRVARRITP